MNTADLPVLQQGTNWNVVDDVIGFVRDCLGEFEHETLDGIQVPIVDVLHFITYNITTKVIYREIPLNYQFFQNPTWIHTIP